jgi:spermidine synthase
MRSRVVAVAWLLCGSGCCALIYQVGWLREFRLIFGASTAASAAVLAIFIGGLGAGGLLLGPRADAHPRPLRFYSTLELIVAATAAMSPLLLDVARAIYLATGGSTRLGMPVATIVRLLLSVVVLAVPTIAMGGTLPAAARAVTQAKDVRRQHLAMLYAANTIGAVAGCLIATFFLLEALGTRSTLWLAAAANALVAMAARSLDRKWAQEARQADDLLEAQVPDGTGARPTLPDAVPAPTAFLLLASATVGFAFFLMELVWYRLLGPLLGGSVFTFGLVLAVALAGIGIGGLLYSIGGRDRAATIGGFAVCCLLEAAAVAATFALGDRIALLALTLLPLGVTGFSAAIAAWTLVTVLVVLAPAIVAGYQFPMLIALFGRGRDHLGRDVGLAYAANTAGAIVGSLAGGFGVLPWLSAPGAWRLVAIVLAALGSAAALLDLIRNRQMAQREGPRPVSRTSPRLTVVVLALLTILMLRAAGPTATWRHSGIGAGRAPRDVLTAANQMRVWSNGVRRAIVWERDGVESSVALMVEQNGYAFIVNGKSDGSARTDAGTQVMLGLLGALGHPLPTRALVIGLGTGSSAGWLGAIPSMERVDAIELEPVVLDVARASEAVNRGVLTNPKVHIAVGDAREALITSRDRYDVIASEPSNPFRAGVASLFTIEFYRAASARLTGDGVFAQWVQAYEIDAPTLRTIYATMAAVFPQVETWQSSTGDLVLVASIRRRGYSADALRARIAAEPFKSALANAWRAVDLDGVLAHFVATDAVARALAAAPRVEINTDDRNVVEFGLARSVGRAVPLLVADLRALAVSIGASRPPLDSDAGIDWSAAQTAWATFVEWGPQTGGIRPASAQEAQRQDALRRYFQANDLAGAREIWTRIAARPRDPSELAMAADLEAAAGSEATTMPLVEQLRAYQQAEADIILAALRLRQSRLHEALAALESALVRLRLDPWPMHRYKEKALTLVGTLMTRNVAFSSRLFDALRQPFSLEAFDDLRLLTMTALSNQIDLAATCREPVGALEPYVPWTPAFLVARRDCYQATKDPRLRIAVRDLEDYLAREPLPLAVR